MRIADHVAAKNDLYVDKETRGDPEYTRWLRNLMDLLGTDHLPRIDVNNIAEHVIDMADWGSGRRVREGANFLPPWEMAWYECRMPTTALAPIADVAMLVSRGSLNADTRERARARRENNVTFVYGEQAYEVNILVFAWYRGQDKPCGPVVRMSLGLDAHGAMVDQIDHNGVGLPGALMLPGMGFQAQPKAHETAWFWLDIVLFTNRLANCVNSRRFARTPYRQRLRDMVRHGIPIVRDTIIAHDEATITRAMGEAAATHDRLRDRIVWGEFHGRFYEPRVIAS